MARKLIFEATKYLLTGALGALIAFTYASLNRLPARSLSVLPAGAKLFQTVQLTCSETQFISEELNTFLTDEIKVPPCNIPLDPEVSGMLTRELERARATWEITRVQFLTGILRQLNELQADPPRGQDLGRGVEEIIEQTFYISQDFPNDVSGAEQLRWALRRVNTAVSNLNEEMTQLLRLLRVVSSEDRSRSTNVLSLFFVATNTSDIEYYYPTQCQLEVNAGGDQAQSVEARLVSLSKSDLPVEDLKYIPLLPGRGQLMEFSILPPEDLFENLETAVRDGVVSSKLVCQLASGELSTRTFNLGRFIGNR